MENKNGENVMMVENISFVINTANNELENLQLLLKSLQKNLDRDTHQIIVFIDSDNQGTYEWLKSVKGDFNDLKIITHSLPPCIGYSRNNNLLVELSDNEIVSYLQSDMVISPGYDTDILRDLENNCILSATRVEPPLHGESPQTITKNFGISPNEFNLDEWNQYAPTVKQDRSSDYFFAPVTFYKSVWLNMGGYDTLFRRSREDSDLVQRCLHLGIKLKQTHNAIVYHFTCTSSRGKDWHNKDNQEAQERVKLQNQADMLELRKFIKKWGGFNHGTDKLVRYDADIIIRNSERISHGNIYQIEPFFSKVLVDNTNEIEVLHGYQKFENSFANQLLGFTDEQWNSAKKYYNQSDNSGIYNTIDNFDNKYNVLVEIDGNNITQQDMYNIQLIHPILSENSEKTGQFELGNIKITINKLVKNTIISMSNPKFDKNLLSIE